LATNPSPLRLTAVITAHDRREYLPAAVESAVGAGADEVIVVRNFSGEIPGQEGRYRDVPCAAAETNEKEALGLEAASGELVGFLDDDDLWTPATGAVLRGSFGARPDLVYLCHGHRPIDAEGRPVAASHPELIEKDPGRFASWDGKDFRRLVRTIWPGNNSSTVVRRSWATDWLPDFRRAGWSADLFWLVAALGSGRSVDILPEPLTLLRLHDRNMSQTRGSTPVDFRRRHRETSERFARSTAVLAELANARTGPTSSMTRYLSEHAEGYRFFAALEAGDRPRRAAWRALRRAGGREDRAVLGTALVALATPAGARRLLYRSGLRRWGLR
jgi:hypothetical protein